jgi:hypothetical protein
MNARVKERVTIRFLSNEGVDAIEIHHRLTAFPVLMNGWMFSDPEDLGAITSTPKFRQDSKKMNLVVFNRLPRS